MKLYNIILSFLSFFVFLIYSESLNAQTPGDYYIKSALGEIYLDVRSGIANEGTPLQIWDFNGSKAQVFKLIHAGEGYYYIQSGLGRYVHVPGPGYAQKTIAAIGSKKASNNFKWQFKYASNGYYYIINKTGTYLDVQWGNAQKGTPVWMWTNSETNAQKWLLEPIKGNEAPLPFITIHMDDDTPSDPDNPHTFIIPADKWKATLKEGLNDLRIHINNYTSTEKPYLKGDQYKWYKGNDSYLRYDAGANSINLKFQTMPIRRDPMTIYFDDINLKDALVTHNEQDIKITLRFETDGLEFRTNCINNFDCGAIGNPNFDLLDPTIDLVFRPFFNADGIYFNYMGVKFKGTIKHAGDHYAPGQASKVSNFFIPLRVDAENLTAKYINETYKKTFTTLLKYMMDKPEKIGGPFPKNVNYMRLDNAGNMVLMLY